MVEVFGMITDFGVMHDTAAVNDGYLKDILTDLLNN